MLFLKIEDGEIERLVRLTAEEKATPPERLARLAFLKGLRLLTKADPETISRELAPEKQAYSRRRPLEEIQAYIREHWEQKTDVQIGDDLDYGVVRIQQIRLKMGLLRKKGRPDKPTSTTEGGPLTSRTEKRNQKFAQLDALIRAHWETKDDWEIGRLFEPHMAGTKVRLRRYELGLKKVQGSKAANRVSTTVKESIDAEEFERMVLHEGYTMIEYLKHKNLTCTRERLRQVAEQMGLKHSPEDRAPEWELMHKARKLNNINLANREWLAAQVADMTSLANLAAQLQIAQVDLNFFVRAFKLTHHSFRKHGAQTVNLVCEKCDKNFVRLKRWVDQRRKKANGHEIEFYCSVPCAGKYDRTTSRKRREAEMSPETQRLQKLKQEKFLRETTYISENWQTMSDPQLAEALQCSTNSIEDKRCALGFKRV